MRAFLLFLAVAMPACWNCWSGRFSSTSVSQWQGPAPWEPSPPRPEPRVWNPLPLEVVFGRPPALMVPPPPGPEPDYEPMVTPTEVSVWLPGHWRWELGWLWAEGQWRQPAGWLYAEGRWIEPPCEGLELVRANYEPAYVEPHWQCANTVACVCPKATKSRVATR